MATYNFDLGIFNGKEDFSIWQQKMREIVSETYKVIILLNSIPGTYKEVKNAIKYDRDTLTPEIIINSLKSFHSSDELVYGSKKKGNDSSSSKFRTKVRKCYDCRNTRYFIKDFYKEKGKLKGKEIDEVNVFSSASNVDKGKVYIITSPITYPAKLNLTINSRLHELILESDASFHVTSQKDWFENLHESMIDMLYCVTGLKLLNEKGVFGNDYVSDLSFCDHCVLDLWGLASNPTSGGNMYFLSIINDYTSKVWVYLLKDKYDTFPIFNNWKRQIENQTGKMIKYLRTVRCMILSSDIPKSFWGEFVMPARYLINLTSSTALNGDTPYEKWPGKLSDYYLLKTFGCVTFSHQSEGKLKSKAKKCVFLGYPEGVKDYRLWDRT
ncbi:uncharacterized protein LOC111411390 [Olea europaea var. sylvestris]|uniref:uncharacterized protein LOC111411390 n=1 Tax=Olea europaea var. sylvestris TaxID=158386 RepID=UPI000C1D2A53|nr:uncharacterized protein LOC111411390 [Olea europaea var. sylvestris]